MGCHPAPSNKYAAPRWVTKKSAAWVNLASAQTVLHDLFDRWERVWHDGRFELIPQCVRPHYIRHDEAGDRIITREVYGAEIEGIRAERPDIRVVVYDHSLK